MIDPEINNDDFMEDPEGDGVLGATHNTHQRCDVSKCPRGKLHSFNWLEDIPGGYADSEMVEVQFKNTRNGFFRNSTNLPLKIGDLVAVEAATGHDIGTVSMVGALVDKMIKRANLKPGTEFKRVFRKARTSDIEKFEEACAKEIDTMIKARKIAESLNLNMKIGDVEYQGDGNKAIFYYIADERVDFRQLIKVLAETFKVRIEMKQIGSRQEAGRIGGIGPCGRPLCCSSWMTNFVSVATSAARYQDISLNPQKLAGQCAKLKCCLNFEVDTYVESIKKLPQRDIHLETITGTYYHFKTDIFKREITYSTDKSMAANLVTITADRAFEIINLNKEGIKPDSLLPDGADTAKPRLDAHDILGDDDLTRFDKKKKKRNKDRRHPKPETADRSDSPRDNATDNSTPRGEKAPSAPANNKETTKEANNNSGSNDNSSSEPKQQPKRDNKQRQPKDRRRGDRRSDKPHRPDNRTPDSPKNDQQPTE